MTERIAFELRDTNKLAGCITVKLRYSDFQTKGKCYFAKISLL